jgi:uncharacterized protein YndB with AHSA1/START domain
MVRRARGGCPAVHDLDGRPARRRVGGDDVRRPDRQEIPWRCACQEVAEPERLVLTLTDRPGDRYEVVTVVLNDLGDGRTEMVFHQGGGHLSAEEYEAAKQRWGAFFDAMAEDLARA